MAKVHRTHVVPNPKGGGWAIKSNGKAAKHVYGKKQDAVAAARSIVKKGGGGEVFVHGRDGRIRQADNYGRGRVGRDIKNPPRGGRLTEAEIRDAVWNGSRALRHSK